MDGPKKLSSTSPAQQRAAQTPQPSESSASKRATQAPDTSTAPVTPEVHLDGVEEAPARISALTSAFEQQQRVIADNQRRITDLSQQIDHLTTQREEELKKPGFGRAVLEIFEFIGRYFTQFFNKISAIFRLIKIGYKLLTGQEVKKDEWVRLGGDLVGVLFPPVGAVINLGMNVFDPFGDPNNKGRSQILGGMDSLFGAEKNSPWREGFDAASGMVKKVFDSAKHLITGSEPAKGGIETRPLASGMRA